MYIQNTPYSQKSLYLDSKDATLNDSGFYQFDLETLIQTPALTKMLITVKEAQIVNVFSNIRTGINDTISITGTVSGTIVYTIPEGYYDVNQFRNVWDALSVTLGTGILMTYSTKTLKLTFTSVTQDFTFNASATTCNCLGLNGDITSSLGSLTMPLIMDFSSDDYVFIKSNIHLRNVNNLGLTSNTLMRVPLTLPFGYTNNYSPQNPTTHLSHEETLSFIQLQITDKQGRSLPLQKTNFQVTIQIGFIYPEENRSYTNEIPLHPFER